MKSERSRRTSPASAKSGCRQLRWGGSIHNFRRTATRDTVLRGRYIAAGQKVVTYYASANRDEEVFGAPFTFDIRRTRNEHLAFGGGGPHFCLGAGLARTQIKALIRELVELLGGRVPQQFVVRGGGQFGPGHEVFDESQQRVGQQVARGLVARDAQQHEEHVDLVPAEPVPVHLGVDERREDVLAGAGPPLAGQGVAVGVDLGGREIAVLLAGRELRVLAAGHPVAPVEDEPLVPGRYADHLADRLDREPGGHLGHEVHVPAGDDGRLHQGGGPLADPGREAAHHPGGEARADQGAVAGVARGVHAEQDQPEGLQGLRTLVPDHEGAELSGPEFGVAADGLDVGVAGDGVEAVVAARVPLPGGAGESGRGAAGPWRRSAGGIRARCGRVAVRFPSRGGAGGSGRGAAGPWRRSAGGIRARCGRVAVRFPSRGGRADPGAVRQGRGVAVPAGSGRGAGGSRCGSPPGGRADPGAVRQGRGVAVPAGSGRGAGGSRCRGGVSPRLAPGGHFSVVRGGCALV
ncbi:cytochrome P450, partial [Streptomyces erythrochromogenes]